MKKAKPLTDEEGEVRELLLEDMKQLRPAAEALSPSLAAKLDIETRPAQQPAARANRVPSGIRQARKVAEEHYPYRCCVVCGLQLPASLTIVHLDHNSGNNDPDNIAYLCGTHHWMYDAGLYPKDAIKLMRAHWQTTAGKPDHKARMKDAGIKAARARKRSIAARKAWQTRRLSQ
jgi:hypothetical protein